MRKRTHSVKGFSPTTKGSVTTGGHAEIQVKGRAQAVEVFEVVGVNT